MAPYVGVATGGAADPAAASSGTATDAEIIATSVRVSHLLNTVTDIAKATTPDWPTMATHMEALLQKNTASLGEIKSLDTRM